MINCFLFFVSWLADGENFSRILVKPFVFSSLIGKVDATEDKGNKGTEVDQFLRYDKFLHRFVFQKNIFATALSVFSMKQSKCPDL